VCPQHWLQKYCTSSMVSSFTMTSICFFHPVPEARLSLKESLLHKKGKRCSIHFEDEISKDISKIQMSTECSIYLKS